MIFIGIIFIVAAITIGYFYNLFVRKQQLVKEAWSGIDVQLKRRYDLVPNLVEVVKGYMAHEKETLEGVTRLRSENSMKSNIKEQASFENNITKGLKTLFAVAEAYPDLKADKQFLELHNNLTLIENEMQMARRYYNGTVREYNILVQSFPSNLIGNVFHFTAEEFFEIEVVTERVVPQVKL